MFQITIACRKSKEIANLRRQLSSLRQEQDKLRKSAVVKGDGEKEKAAELRRTRREQQRTIRALAEQARRDQAKETKALADVQKNLREKEKVKFDVIFRLKNECFN